MYIKPRFHHRRRISLSAEAQIEILGPCQVATDCYSALIHRAELVLRLRTARRTPDSSSRVAALMALRHTEAVDIQGREAAYGSQ